MERKFYRTRIVFEILSEVPTENMDIAELVYEADEGGMVGDVREHSCSEITVKECAELLGEFRSDPEFFGLDDNGNESNDDEEIN